MEDAQVFAASERTDSSLEVARNVAVEGTEHIVAEPSEVTGTAAEVVARNTADVVAVDAVHNIAAAVEADVEVSAEQTDAFEEHFAFAEPKVYANVAQVRAE